MGSTRLTCGAVLMILGAACAGPDEGPASRERIMMATTTSTAASGFLDAVLPIFEKETGIAVRFIAVGSGAALKHGENGDVDLVLVHSAEAEKAFVRAGFGLARVPLMATDFILLGPDSDPASIRGADRVAEAFTRISRAAAPFVSRGDSSGTHVKEREIWREAGIEPRGAWYLESGQGMGPCLLLADEKTAYTLCDRATYLAWRDKVRLALLLEGDPLLANPYSLIAVAPERRPGGNHRGALRLIAWFTSAHGREVISGFQVNGQALFTPAAGGSAAP